MLVCCVGDSVLDVIVSVEDGLALDDDVPAEVSLRPGGQAVNIAAWVRYAGHHARYLGPRSTSATGAVLQQHMDERGIQTSGPALPARPGAVVSVISGGRRSMASDAGGLGWPDSVFLNADLSAADWLMVSGYTLYRLADPRLLIDLCGRADEAGINVGIDLSSAVLLESYGAARAREAIALMRPDVVFANDAEWAGLDMTPDFDLVNKHGARGCSFHTSSGVQELPPEAATVLDTTGAGDALAAGYLVGGPPLAMHLAAQCVAQVGAQPPSIVDR